MRSKLRTTGVILSCSILAFLVGCGSKSSSTNNALAENHAPVATAPTASVTGSTLAEYATTTFSTTTSDPDLGDTVASVTWDFGDGSAAVVATNGPTFATPHVYNAALASVTVTATPKDSHGLAGTAASSTFVVAQAPNPFTLAVSSSPTTTQSIPLGGAAQVALAFTVDYSGSNSWSIATPADVAFTSGATGSGTPTFAAQGGGVYTATLTYPSGGAVGDTYTATPTVTVKDSAGITSATLTFPAITFRTVVASTAPPTIAISQPQSLNTQIYALQTASLGLYITDIGQFDTTVTVDWGDGTTPTVFTLPGGSLNPGTAPATAPTHPYQQAGTYTVTVSATDTQTSGNTATPQTRTYTVLANALPSVAITSPQASGSLPAAPSDIAVVTPSAQAGQLTLPVQAKYPQVVVIPMNGQLNFSCTATGPGSGDAYTLQWTFPGGNPSTSTDPNPGSVSFSGVPGQIVAYLVEAVATDAFGRTSNQVGPTTSTTDEAVAAAPTFNTTPYRKWVVVDGTQTQTFYLNFLYRLLGDTAATPTTLLPVTSSDNGLGASVQIFQDGVSNTYAVQSGNQASLNVPVRANLPFWISIPGFGRDTMGYVLRIPNAPTGTYMDPSLVAAGTPPPATSASFAFQNAAAPFNPVLNLVTGQGYAAEGSSPALRMLEGWSTLGGNLPTTPPKTDRWFNMMTVPATDDTATQFVMDNTTANAFSAIKTFQSFPAWCLYQKTLEPDLLSTDSSKDTASTSEGTPADLGFKLDYTTYGPPTAKSKTFATVGLEAFRVPPSPADPYNLSTGQANWNGSDCTVALTPTQITNAGVLSLFDDMIYQGPGATALSGGLDGLTIPYDPNDVDRKVLASPQIRAQEQGIPVFAEAEYLWCSAWMRPLVLNTALLSQTDSRVPSAFPWYRYSVAASWPSYTASPAIVPDGSTFDLTVNGGPAFDAHSPVSTTSSAPDAKAVGRFYWTAFNPKYNGADGACIARTWLSTAAGLPPTTFTGTAADANNLLGFLPPQDPVIDKRQRDATGAVVPGTTTGGYRITWFNPTKAADHKTCVPPDFWVVEVSSNGTTRHFLLPASFPAAPATGADTTQTASAQVLTDARYYLPSGNSAAAGPGPNDTVAPGYCWFDLPSELRPVSGSTATVAIFALKSVLANNPAAGAYPRPLNRTDWIDAVKTATATMKMDANAGKDLSYAYKIPFGFGWDIVVTNCEFTTVAP